MGVAPPPLAAPPAWTRCRLCKIKLGADADDDLVRGLCGDCRERPEAQRLAVGRNGAAPSAPAMPARTFTEADRSLIRAMHGYLPAAQLLEILNERLRADLGDAVSLYTLEQLHHETQRLGTTAAAAGDWTSLRRLLGQARRSGVLEAITPDVVHAFAVVFGLSTAQATHLKDVLRHARGESA